VNDAVVRAVLEIQEAIEVYRRFGTAGQDLGEQLHGLLVILASAAPAQRRAAASVRGCDAGQDRDSGGDARRCRDGVALAGDKVGDLHHFCAWDSRTRASGLPHVAVRPVLRGLIGDLHWR